MVLDYQRGLRLYNYSGSYIRIRITGDLQFKKGTILLLAQLRVDSFRSV